MYQTGQQERQGDFVKFFTSRELVPFDGIGPSWNQKMVWKDLIKRLEIIVIII
jgi:hypothetical protein